MTSSPTVNPFPEYTPPTQPIPSSAVQPAEPDQRNGIDPNYIPPGILQEEATQFLFAWIKSQGPHRGVFKIEKDPANQQFPGVTLPPWLITLLNQIAGHPALGYNYDRTTMHRDLLFLAVAAVVQVLSTYDKSDEVQQAVHIVRSQAALRQELFVEELMLAYTEDLAISAGVLDLKLRAHALGPLHTQLKKMFHHVEQIADREFWRPMIRRLLLSVPEVQQTIEMLGESDQYLYDTDFQAWAHMLAEHRQQQQQGQQP